MSRSTQPSLRLAIFDFDGTLCATNSYHAFLWWTVKRYRPASLLILTGIALRKLRIISRPALMRLALGFLKGKTRAEVEAIGAELYHSVLKPSIADAGLTEIRARRDEGCSVLILSGAFDFLLGPFCAAESIDRWRSTRLAYERDRCTGFLDGPEHLGQAKSSYVQEMFKSSEVDWHGSFVYSDELTDLPLFSLVGNKFFVVHGNNKVPDLPETFTVLRW